MTVEDILFENFNDALTEIDEGHFWNDRNHVITWATIADTFAEMF
jgi:hypothetical protein